MPVTPAFGKWCESCDRMLAAVILDPDGARYEVCGACALVWMLPGELGTASLLAPVQS